MGKGKGGRGRGKAREREGEEEAHSLTDARIGGADTPRRKELHSILRALQRHLEPLFTVSPFSSFFKRRPHPPHSYASAANSNYIGLKWGCKKGSSTSSLSSSHRLKLYK